MGAMGAENHSYYDLTTTRMTELDVLEGLGMTHLWKRARVRGSLLVIDSSRRCRDGE